MFITANEQPTETLGTQDQAMEERNRQHSFLYLSWNHHHAGGVRVSTMVVR